MFRNIEHLLIPHLLSQYQYNNHKSIHNTTSNNNSDNNNNNNNNNRVYMAIASENGKSNDKTFSSVKCFHNVIKLYGFGYYNLCKDNNNIGFNVFNITSEH